MLAGVTLTGSSGDDFIEIGLSANFQNVIGKLNNFEVFNVPDSSIDTIVINAGGGSDSIFVDEPGDNTTNVTGGAGGDALILSDLAKDILNTFAGCTVTFDGGPGDLGNVDQNERVSTEFSSPGTYAYVCTYHPNMRGTVVVK